MFDFSETVATKLSKGERLARLQLAWSENVGSVTYKHLLASFGSAEKALDALPQMAKRGGSKKAIKICPKSKAISEIEKIEAFKAEFLILGDEDYPTNLANIEDAPPILAIKGHKHLLDKNIIGMVGARNASSLGKKMSYGLAKDLGAEGFVIASGLARGIDTASHEGSIATGTIGVLGTGLDIIYPKENAELQARISNEGLLISEHTCGTKPNARNFPRRNRIISGLSKGVLVVEAAMRSGSLITARLASEQGRDVFAVPGSPLDPRAKGTNNLIRNGAQMVESASDVIEAIETLQYTQLMDPSMSLFENNDAMPNMDDDNNMAEKIMNELSPTPSHIDDIIRDSKLPSNVVLSTILELELAGRIERHFGNKISASI